MAVTEVQGPTDVATAFIRGGKLVVVDGRGVPWTYDGSKKRKDARGEEIEGPSSFEQVIVFDDKNKRVVVVDGSGVCWTYLASENQWIEGGNIEDKIDRGDEDKDNPWTKGANIEARKFNPDELRRAQATVDAAEAMDEDGKSKKRKREAA